MGRELPKPPSLHLSFFVAQFCPRCHLSLFLTVIAWEWEHLGKLLADIQLCCNVGINVKYDIYEVKSVQPFFLCLLAIKAVLIIGPSIYSDHRVTQWCFAAVWLLKWPCVSCVGCRKAVGAKKLFLFLHLSFWLALVLLSSCSPSQEKDIWACWLQHLCCHTLQLPRRPWVH